MPPELEKEGQESKILLPCWAVLTSLSVFLSSLWASPLLLFSAKEQFEKERHEVVHPSKGARSYSAVPLFLSLDATEGCFLRGYHASSRLFFVRRAQTVRGVAHCLFA